MISVAMVPFICLLFLHTSYNTFVEDPTDLRGILSQRQTPTNSIHMSREQIGVHTSAHSYAKCHMGFTCQYTFIRSLHMIFVNVCAYERTHTLFLFPSKFLIYNM